MKVVMPRGEVASDSPDILPIYIFAFIELERARAILRLTIYL